MLLQLSATGTRLVSALLWYYRRTTSQPGLAQYHARVVSWEETVRLEELLEETFFATTAQFYEAIGVCDVAGKRGAQTSQGGMTFLTMYVRSDGETFVPLYTDTQPSHLGGLTK